METYTMRFSIMVIRNITLTEVEKWRSKLVRTGYLKGVAPVNHSINNIEYAWDEDMDDWARI